MIQRLKYMLMNGFLMEELNNDLKGRLCFCGDPAQITFFGSGSFLSICYRCHDKISEQYYQLATYAESHFATAKSNDQ